ncbi:MAG: hypothetical protein GQ474_04865 [Sulfurimonas sp.]|nr:hypothetical protein [Sulfurimonas sp.]
MNNNKITTIAIIVIAVGVSYLAISKATEDTPQEKLLQSLYGTSDIEEINEIKALMPHERWWFDATVIKVRKD